MGAATLSVIMPNYNHAHHLRGALEAVVRQSFQPKEVLVLDDASTDDSVAVVQGLSSRYPFVRLLRNERNRGPVSSSNRLLREASGDYVYPGASDDRVLPGFFEKAMGLLQEHPQAALVSGLGRHLGPKDEDLGSYWTPCVCDKACYLPPERVVSAFKRHGNWIVAYAVIFKRSALLDIGGYDEELGPSCDGFAWQVLSLKHGACFIPEELAMWRESPGGYAGRQTADPGRAVGLVEALERRMKTTYRDVHPPDYAESWKRRAVLSLIEGASLREPFPREGIAGLGPLLPSMGALDRAFFAALRLSPPALGRLLTKLYLFSQKEAAEKRRILVRKLGCGL